MGHKFLHISKLHILVEEGTGKPLNIKYRKLSTGEMIFLREWVCTNWHSKGRTLNVRNPENGEVRTLRRILIVEFNGVELIV
ncbi:MAG: hypothetical protein ACRC9X_01020 [Bacteroidales bacterium]